MFSCCGRAEEEKDLERFVISITFFDSLDAGKVKHFTRFFKRAVYKENQVIVPVGAKIDNFYIIAKGSVKFGPSTSEGVAVSEAKYENHRGSSSEPAQPLRPVLEVCFELSLFAFEAVLFAVHSLNN